MPPMSGPSTVATATVKTKRTSLPAGLRPAATVVLPLLMPNRPRARRLGRRRAQRRRAARESPGRLSISDRQLRLHLIEPARLARQVAQRVLDLLGEMRLQIGRNLLCRNPFRRDEQSEREHKTLFRQIDAAAEIPPFIRALEAEHAVGHEHAEPEEHAGEIDEHLALIDRARWLALAGRQQVVRKLMREDGDQAL